jgi:hypothetical protein
VGNDKRNSVKPAQLHRSDDIHIQPVNGIELTRYFLKCCPAATVIGFSNTFLKGY